MLTRLYYELTTKEKESFFVFLKNEYEQDSSPARINMFSESWESEPNTLPYILEKTTRFKQNGMFQILIDKDNIIGCSGCYTSNFSEEICILGARTWISKKYRNLQLVRNILLPNEKKYAIQHRYKLIVLTFNDYNKNLSKIWFKNRLGESRLSRTHFHFGYNNLNILNFPVKIQYTKQWIIYELLDKNFIYDWTMIQWN